MATKPTLIFVPGSWHKASCWDKITSLLSPQYKCIPINLPTNLSNPAATLLDDITAVRNAIIAETTQGRDVVVVVHSYGGIVGASAIKGLTLPKKTQDDSSTSSAKEPSGQGHVIGLVMLATGFAIAGLSFLDATGGKPPPSWKLDPASGFVVFTNNPPPLELFYHDLPVPEAEYWVSQLTPPSSLSLTSGGEHMYAGWRDVPCWYLVTSQDRALPFEVQKHFVQSAKDAGADVTAREIESSHSPMLSKPEETATFIEEAVAAFTK